MKYYQGDHGVWVKSGNICIYMGTEVHWGAFKIEPTTFDGHYRYAEVSREEAVEFCSKWPEAIAKINEIDPIEPLFIPHTDQEQLEIVKARIGGSVFTKIDAKGQNSAHTGPFDFVNFRYAEVAKTLEEEVEEFLLGTIGEHPDCHLTPDCIVRIKWSRLVNLRKALRCYQTNKGQ